MATLNKLYYLLLLSQLVSLPALVQGQCSKPTEEVIEDLLMSHVMEDIELTQYAISCLSSGGIRDMYQQASIIVNFLSNVTIESCPPSPTGCRGFFHIVCSDELPPSWMLDDVSPPNILQLNDEANIDIEEPRTDCGACSYLGLFPPDFTDQYDANTHCYVCDCDGQGLCVGLQECCSFFDADICTSDCGENRFASEETDFNCVCTNENLILPDCAECGLQCNNRGTQNINCTACDCIGGFEGFDCSVCSLNCMNGSSLNSTSNCTECICVGGFEGSDCSICPLNCVNGGSPNSDCTACDCIGGFQGSDCSICPLNCTNGSPNSDCTACDCIGGFQGPDCSICPLNCMNGSPNSDCTACDCIGGFQGSDCSICPLNCTNGSPNSDCTACDCIGGFQGSDCSICPLNCVNGGSPNNDCTACDCIGGFQGSDCSICPLNCTNGSPNSDCTACDCIGGFQGSDCSICPLNCVNGGSPNNDCTACDCIGGFQGSNCSICPLNCMNGGSPNSDCTACDCPPNFGGDSCEDCMLPNCQVCSTVAGECYTCLQGFKLDDENQCVVACPAEGPICEDIMFLALCQHIENQASPLPMPCLTVRNRYN